MRRRIVVVAVIGAALAAGCGSSPPPAAPVTSATASPTAAAPTTTSPAGAVQALFDRAGVRADLDRLPKDVPACAQQAPGAACRDAVALARSIADRLGAAILASGDPTPDDQLNDDVRSLGNVATDIETYCYGRAVDRTECRRAVDIVPTFVDLIKYAAIL